MYVFTISGEVILYALCVKCSFYVIMDKQGKVGFYVFYVLIYFCYPFKTHHLVNLITVHVRRM